MPSLPRRRFLGAMTALAAGTGGCTADPGGSDGTETATATVGERTFAHCRSDPATQQARDPEGAPIVRSSAFTPAGGWSRTEWVVASPSDREALEYAEGATGIDGLRGFIDETDLSEHSVLVHQQHFRDCLSLRVRRLKWTVSETAPERGHDVAVEYEDDDRTPGCGAGDSELTITTVLRLPAEIENIVRFTAGSVSIGEDDC